MKTRTLSSLLIIAFVLVAVFGLYVPMDHSMGCPFAAGGSSVCGVPFAHLEHWQNFLAAVFAELLVWAFAYAFFYLGFLKFRDQQYERYRLRASVLVRPTLVQELFARGILNPKDP